MVYLQIAETVPAPLLGAAPPNTNLLESAAKQALLYASAPAEADLSIVLTDDEQLHQLNLQFLDVDAPTDVLSFPDGDTDPDTGVLYLGDILISVPRAQDQAKLGGHTLQDELQLLVIHGVLHLLGYDHADESEKARMWEAQAKILTQLGCAEIMTRDE
jgi:probable rRNA maturation factor